MTLQSITPSRRSAFCPKAAGFRKVWPLLNAARQLGQERGVLSTSREWIHAMLTCCHNTRALTFACVVSPRHLGKLEQILNITPDDIDTLVLKARIAQARGDLPRASALLAPLRLGADYVNALETQVYQDNLESRPAP